jgi:uncharacterized repeat protein (TIGR02543 family)
MREKTARRPAVLLAFVVAFAMMASCFAWFGGFTGNKGGQVAQANDPPEVVDVQVGTQIFAGDVLEALVSNILTSTPTHRTGFSVNFLTSDNATGRALLVFRDQRSDEQVTAGEPLRWQLLFVDARQTDDAEFDFVGPRHDNMIVNNAPYGSFANAGRRYVFPYNLTVHSITAAMGSDAPITNANWNFSVEEANFRIVRGEPEVIPPLDAIPDAPDGAITELAIGDTIRAGTVINGIGRLREEVAHNGRGSFRIDFEGGIQFHFRHGGVDGGQQRWRMFIWIPDGLRTQWMPIIATYRNYGDINNQDTISLFDWNGWRRSPYMNLNHLDTQIQNPAFGAPMAPIFVFPWDLTVSDINPSYQNQGRPINLPDDPDFNRLEIEVESFYFQEPSGVNITHATQTTQHATFPQEIPGMTFNWDTATPANLTSVSGGANIAFTGGISIPSFRMITRFTSADGPLVRTVYPGRTTPDADVTFTVQHSVAWVEAREAAGEIFQVFVSINGVPLSESEIEDLIVPGSPPAVDALYIETRYRIPSDEIDGDIVVALVLVYELTLELNGGSLADPPTTYHSQTTELPAPEWLGRTFLGWFLTATGADDEPVVIGDLRGDQTLHARWETHRVNVTFNVNAGTGSTTPSTPGAYTGPLFDTVFGTLPVITRDGYAFAGWFNHVSAGTEITSTTVANAANVPNGESITLFARWTANTINVVFNKNHADATGDMPNQPFTFDAAVQALSANAFVRTNFEFAGWALTSTGEVRYTDAQQISIALATGVFSGNYTLYAIWNAPGQSTIILRDAHATLTDAPFTGTTAGVPTTHTNGDATPLTVVPTRTGYTFRGWFMTSTGGSFDDRLLSLSAETTFPSTITLYAAWQVNTVNVTFNSHGGSEATGYTNPTFGSAFGALPVVTRTGYDFNGWFASAEGGTALTAESLANATLVPNGSSVTLHAQWTAIQYSVVFSANGGTGTMSNQTHTFGIAQALTANTFTRAGHTFAGWNTLANGTGTNVENSLNAVHNFRDEPGEFTLFARWTANVYTITYRDVGNTAFSGNNELALQQTHTFGVLTTLVPGARVGFAFGGWFLAENGSGTAIDVLVGTQFTANITLFAAWTPAVFNVTFNQNGGTGASNTTYTFGTGLATLPTPTREGHTFDGWFNAATGGTRVTSIASDEVGDVTLWARWTEVEEEKKGCRSTLTDNVIGPVVLLSLFAGAFVVFMIAKRGKENA